MKPLARVLVLLLAVLCLAGCRTKRKKGEEMATRKECNKPSFQCYDNCAKREASNTCDGCCWDQRYLCDTGQKHSFEYCKDAP
jgi:hypothetical protein